MSAAVRVALYARVSTKEGRQHLSGQARQAARVRRPAQVESSRRIHDQVTGAKSRRPGLDALMKAAAGRAFDAVLVFDLSRLTRGGPAQAFKNIHDLKKFDVEFFSMNEPHFRTAEYAETEIDYAPPGDLFVAIAAHIAQMERYSMRKRIRAGLDRARKAGRQFGRPRRLVDSVRLRDLEKQGLSYRQMAKALNCGVATVLRRLRELPPEEEPITK